MAGPGDAGEGHQRPIAEHQPSLHQSLQIGNGVGVIVQSLPQLRVAQPVQHHDVHSLRPSPQIALAVLVQDVQEGLAILALQAHVRIDASLTGGAAAGVIAVDKGEAQEDRQCRRHVHLRADRVRDAGPDARPDEDQRRPRLHHVQSAVLPKLPAESVRLGVDHDVRGVGAIEQLGDALHRQRVGEMLRLHERPRRVRARVAGPGPRLQLLRQGGQRRRVLAGDGVLTDLLDGPVAVAAVGVEALEADHPPLGPHLVGVVAVGDHQVGLRAAHRVRQQRRDGAVAGLLLVGVQPLSAGPLRPRDALLPCRHRLVLPLSRCPPVCHPLA